MALSTPQFDLIPPSTQLHGLIGQFLYNFLKLFSWSSNTSLVLHLGRNPHTDRYIQVSTTHRYPILPSLEKDI